MASSITAQYAAGVAAGHVGSDDAQLAVIERLARLEVRIAEHRLARKSSSLGWLFGNRKEPPIKGNMAPPRPNFSRKEKLVAWLTAAGIKVFSFVAPLAPPYSYMGPGVAGFMILGVIYLIYLYLTNPGRITDVGLVHLDAIDGGS